MNCTDTNFNVRRNFTEHYHQMVMLQLLQVQMKHLLSLASDDFTVSIMTTGSGGTRLTPGDVLNLSGNNHEVTAYLI